MKQIQNNWQYDEHGLVTIQNVLKLIHVFPMISIGVTIILVSIYQYQVDKNDNKLTEQRLSNND